MWRVLALILCAVVSLSADTAAATTIADKNDVRGELDLRAASLGKVLARSGALHLRVRWDTYGIWTVRDCRTAQEVNGACDVRARLDTRGRSASRATGRGIDYSVVWGPLACSVTDLATNVVVVRERRTRVRAERHVPSVVAPL